MILLIDSLYTERYNKREKEKGFSGEGVNVLKFWRAFMENRMLLLQCAKELFYAKGYDAVGVQEIVEKAGLTKPTLYYYFGSKIGILQTLIETKFEELRTSVAAALREEGDIRAHLYRLAETYCYCFECDREFYMLMMALFYSARENEAYKTIRPYVTEFYETVVQMFEDASDQLGNMNGRQRQFAVGFIGTVNHYLLVHCEIDPDHTEEISKEQKSMEETGW